MRGKSKPSTGKDMHVCLSLHGLQSLTRLPSDSAINLTKNSQFYVRQGDVERLIAQGYLQKLS